MIRACLTINFGFVLLYACNYSVNMRPKYSPVQSFCEMMDFNTIFVLLAPFWAAMVFINAKVMIEVNREWGLNSQDQKEKIENMQK